MKNILAVLIFLAVAPSALRADSPTNSAADQPLEAIRKKYDLPALALIVVKDGKICERDAVGLRKIGETTPVTTNDIFHIGSCTKPMTATLAGILIEDGKLRWNTTIAEVFPELKGKMDKQYETVTLEQLLQHRGGVPGTPPPTAWARAWLQKGTPTDQRRELIEATASLPSPESFGVRQVRHA